MSKLRKFSAWLLVAIMLVCAAIILSACVPVSAQKPVKTTTEHTVNLGARIDAPALIKELNETGCEVLTIEYSEQQRGGTIKVRCKSLDQ